MLRKLLALVLVCSFLLTIPTAFSQTATPEPVTISYYSTQAGVDNETKILLGEFMKEHPWITVNYYPVGDDQLAAWLALYAAGNAPTVAMLDCGQILNYSDYMLDINKEENAEWMSHVLTGFDFFKKEGSDAIYGIPSSVQGFGLMYNKRLVNEVFGEGYDVNQVNTIDKLKAFFAAFEEAGHPATVVFSADWALGAHYLLCQYFSEWLGDKAAQRKILADLKRDDYSLIEDAHFNNMMDVFDLMLAHNINKADPLADTQEGDLQMLATGQVATMFQGDWNWLAVRTFDERDDLAIMPLPLSNDENDPRNGKLLASCPKGYAVDTYQNTPEQQAAGVLLASWLALSPQGQEFMVSMIGSTLPFDNVTAVNENPLAVSTQEYSEAGKILDISTALCETPSDFWLINGPYMQAYMAGQLDRAGLAAEVEAYFAELE